ncbi:hypothetical protein KR032_011681, partial [Drosophila birchii]
AAFKKSSLMARFPPHAPATPPGKSGDGAPTDSSKRGRDPAGLASDLRGTLPKKSKAAQEEPTSEAGEGKERKPASSENVSKLGKMLDELHCLINEKQVRYITVAM